MDGRLGEGGCGMKVIVAGPRDLMVSDDVVEDAINESGFAITELVHGGASGIDYCALRWSEEAGMPEMPFPAAWDFWSKRGNRKKAGWVRNRQMAGYADALVVIKRAGKETAGTSSMIREATKAGLPIYVHELAKAAA